MCVCVSQNTRDSSTWKLSKLWFCEIYECLRKREKKKIDRVPFLRQSQDRRKETKHLAVNRQQISLRAQKFSLQPGRMAKNMNANRIRVKSSRLNWESRSKIRLEKVEENKMLDSGLFLISPHKTTVASSQTFCLHCRRCPPAPDC